MSSTILQPGQKILLPNETGGNNAVAPVKQVSRNTDRVKLILDYAKSFVGVPYVYGGGTPRGFDCSGYLKYVYAHFGIDLPRTADQQYRTGQSIPSGQARPGDLVAFKSGGYISHIGIYLGSGKFISATSSRGVIIDPVYSSYWGKRFFGFSRIMP